VHLTRDSIRLFSIGTGFLFTNNVHRNLFLAKKGGVVSSKENATEGVNNHSVLFIYLFILCCNISILLDWTMEDWDSC